MATNKKDRSAVLRIAEATQSAQAAQATANAEQSKVLSALLVPKAPTSADDTAAEPSRISKRRPKGKAKRRTSAYETLGDLDSLLVYQYEICCFVGFP